MKTDQSGRSSLRRVAEPIVDGDSVVANTGRASRASSSTPIPGERVKGVASIAVTLEWLMLPDGRTVARDHPGHTAGKVDQEGCHEIGVPLGSARRWGPSPQAEGRAIALVWAAAPVPESCSTRGDPAVIWPQTPDQLHPQIAGYCYKVG